MPSRFRYLGVVVVFLIILSIPVFADTTEIKNTLVFKANQNLTKIFEYQKGDDIEIFASGLAKYAPDSPKVSPKGTDVQLTSGVWPCRTAKAISLYGISNKSACFQIGEHYSFKAITNDSLYLGINDDFLPDNSGEWVVTIKVVRALPEKEGINNTNISIEDNKTIKEKQNSNKTVEQIEIKPSTSKIRTETAPEESVGFFGPFLTFILICAIVIYLVNRKKQDWEEYYREIKDSELSEPEKVLKKYRLEGKDDEEVEEMEEYKTAIAEKGIRLNKEKWEEHYANIKESELTKQGEVMKKYRLKGISDKEIWKMEEYKNALVKQETENRKEKWAGYYKEMEDLELSETQKVMKKYRLKGMYDNEISNTKEYQDALMEEQIRLRKKEIRRIKAKFPRLNKYNVENHFLCEECDYLWKSRKSIGEPGICPKCHSSDIKNLEDLF